MEAWVLGSVVEHSGIIIGKGFVAGATAVKDGLEEATEETGKGLVSLGKYPTPYACDIALAGALTAVFTALAADQTEEESVGALAVLATTQFADNEALNVAAKSLASIVANPVYAIPGLSDAVGQKRELESICAFIIITACKANPEIMIGTGGQLLAGALIYGISHMVCEGEVPKGYHVWKSLQS